MICVDVAAVGMSQPDKQLFAGVDLTISTGDRVAIVGVNGSGKTTLLRTIAAGLARQGPPSAVQFYGLDFADARSTSCWRCPTPSPWPRRRTSSAPPA